MKISTIIYYTIGIVTLHFIHGSETLKAKKTSPTAIQETELRQPRRLNDIHVKRNYIKNVPPKINEQPTKIRSEPRQVYSNRYPMSEHYRHSPPHQQTLRLKPILRRRYQINTNSLPNQGYPMNKIYRQQLSPNYPPKNYPIKKYYKSPPQYHHKISHYNPNLNHHHHLHQRHNNIHRVSPKLSQQNYFNIDGKNDLKSSYSHLQKSPITFGSKGFNASPTFNGNVIVRPTVHQKHIPKQQHQEQLLHQEIEQQRQEEDYYHSTKPYPSSSYAVYDDTSDDITQKPIQYHVQLKNPSSLSENSIPVGGNSKSTKHNEESEKYLNFMTSRDYFLPKSQPDYHIRTGSSINGDINDQEQQHVKENYMNVKTHLDFGGGQQQFYPSNDFDKQNYYHKINKDSYDPAKLEFTENDAIHSSFTSNPQKDYNIDDDLKKNYGNKRPIYSSSSVFNVASLTAAGNKINNDKEKWSTPITDITKRKDTFLIKSMSDEQISKECSKKCFSETKDSQKTGEIDANLGFNEIELDCYESCINTYSGGQNN